MQNTIIILGIMSLWGTFLFSGYFAKEFTNRQPRVFNN